MKLLATLAIALFTTVSASAQTNDVRVRVIHASPDAPTVNVLVNGNLAFEGVPYKSYTGYAALPAGTIQVQLQVAPAGAIVYTRSITLAAGEYSLVALGKVSGGNNALNVFEFRDDLQSAPNFAKIRVIHAAPSAPTVDVYATGAFFPLAPASPTLANVPFAAGSGFVAVPGGAYQARVTVAGTKTVAIDSGTLPLVGGSVRTILAIDPDKEGGAFQLLTIPDVN